MKCEISYVMDGKPCLGTAFQEEWTHNNWELCMHKGDDKNPDDGSLVVL